jgi:AcrR family transcriptional regulator
MVQLMARTLIRKRKDSERRTRRQFIVDAARTLFGENGIENTTMEDIAVASGYTRRTLYAYFKSFDEICLVVLHEDQTTRWELQKEAIAASTTGLAKLQAWARTLYRFAADNPQYMRLEIYWDYHGLNPRSIGRPLFDRFTARNNELADGLREIFRLGMADGSMRKGLEVDMCISQFLYSLRSIINRAISPGYSFASFDADDYVAHYIEFFCRAIEKNGRCRR